MVCWQVTDRRRKGGKEGREGAEWRTDAAFQSERRPSAAASAGSALNIWERQERRRAVGCEDPQAGSPFGPLYERRREVCDVASLLGLQDIILTTQTLNAAGGFSWTYTNNLFPVHELWFHENRLDLRSFYALVLAPPGPPPPPHSPSSLYWAFLFLAQSLSRPPRTYFLSRPPRTY